MTVRPVPWRITLRCTTEGCPNRGNEQQVNLPRPAAGFVEIPSFRCAGCNCEPRQTSEGVAP